MLPTLWAALMARARPLLASLRDSLSAAASKWRATPAATKRKWLTYAAAAVAAAALAAVMPWLVSELSKLTAPPAHRQTQDVFDEAVRAAQQSGYSASANVQPPVANHVRGQCAPEPAGVVYYPSEEKTSWSTVMVLLIGAWTAWRAYVDYTAEYVVVPPSYLSSDVMHARNPPSKVWQVGRTSPNELTFYYDQHQGGARPTQHNQLASRAAPLALPAPPPQHQQYGGVAEEELPLPPQNFHEQPQQMQQQQKSTGWFDGSFFFPQFGPQATFGQYGEQFGPDYAPQHSEPQYHKVNAMMEGAAQHQAPHWAQPAPRPLEPAPWHHHDY